MSQVATEFMPSLNEGTLLFMPMTLPGVFGGSLAVVPPLRPYEASSEHGGQWI
jgi:hypothetical protein